MALGESPYLQRHHQRSARLLEPPAPRSQSDRPGSESAMMEEDLDVPIAAVSRRREVVFFGDKEGKRLKRLDDDDHDEYERQVVYDYFSSPSLRQRPCDESAIESPFAKRRIVLGASPSQTSQPKSTMTTAMSAANRRKRRTSLLWDDIISVHEESPGKKFASASSSSSPSPSPSPRFHRTAKEE
jgi:hypothetical protein